MPTPPLAIVGTGGLGREVASLAADAGREIAGFLDDDAGRIGTQVAGLPVIGSSTRFPDGLEVIVAVGNPRVRRAIIQRLRERGAAFAGLVHPTAHVGPRVTIGVGTVVPAGCVITCDVSIGMHCVVGPRGVISHDCQLDDFVTIAPGVTLPGNTHMQNGSEVAIGATMRQQLTIGRGAILGMGAVLTRDLPDGRLWYGAPARDVRAVEPWDKA